MEVVLYSITELIQFIKTTPLAPQQLKALLAKGYNIYIYGDESISEVISFLEKYKDSEMIPLFLD